MGGVGEWCLSLAALRPSPVSSPPGDTTLGATSCTAGQIPRVHTFWEGGEVQRGYRAQGSTLGRCIGTGKYGNRGLGGTGDNFCVGVRAVVPLETARLGGGSSLGGWVNPEGV